MLGACRLNMMTHVSGWLQLKASMATPAYLSGSTFVIRPNVSLQPFSIGSAPSAQAGSGSHSVTAWVRRAQDVPLVSVLLADY